MKQKNYDVQQLYKEYMQGVTADRTAIDEILSGERRAAGTGARIKRSTGKMVGITAAAAAIAICAGVGLSHLNANDDSSIKSAASTSQSSSALTPAKQITQSFKLEAAPLQADGQLAKTTLLTLTATDEAGKEIIKKYAHEKSSSYYSEAYELSVGGKTENLRPEVVDSTGYHHEGDYRWRVVSISEDKVVFEFMISLHKAVQEDIPFTVNVFMPSDKEYTAEEAATGVNKDPIIASAKLVYKKNAIEYNFVSQYGEKLTVSDVGFILRHDVGYDEKNEKETNAINNMLFTFADGTSKTAAQLGQKLTYGGGYLDGQYRAYVFFSEPIGADKIISITYDGITYNKVEEVNVEQAKFKTEMTEMFASDHSLRVNVKLTALNDDAKKLLALDAKAKASNGKTRIKADPINLDELPTIGSSSVSTSVINGDTLTTTITFNRVNSSDTFKDGTKFDIVFTCTEKEGTDCRLIPADRRLTVTVKKNVPERVFKSASGKTMWLSDYHFNVGMDGNGLDKTTFNNFEITFADGTVKTPFNMQCLANGATKSEKGDPNTIAAFEKIDSTKVTSVKYAGEVFTPQ